MLDEQPSNQRVVVGVGAERGQHVARAPQAQAQRQGEQREVGDGDRRTAREAGEGDRGAVRAGVTSLGAPFSRAARIGLQLARWQTRPSPRAPKMPKIPKLATLERMEP